MTRLRTLPPVVRHITVPPSPSFARPFIQSKGCELHPKKPLSDGRIPGAFHNLFVSTSRPNIHEDNLADEEADGKCLVKSGGLNFRVTDIAPGVKGDMHKTTSIDFLVVHRGEVVLHLEGGVQKTIKEGEAIVQRGTVHAWENPSPDQWVRMFVVLVDADGS